MKKFLLLFLPLIFIGLTTIACNSDDDSGTPSNVDPIVGTWKVSDVQVGGQSVYAVLLLTNPCPLQNLYQLNNDFSVNVETFEADTNGNCVAGEPQSGTWSKEGSTYYISAYGQTGNSEVEFIDDNNFTFNTEMEGQQAKVKMTRQ